jgi:hypothetical protein
MAEQKIGPKEQRTRELREQAVDSAAKNKRIKLKGKVIGKLSTVRASKRGK